MAGKVSLLLCLAGLIALSSDFLQAQAGPQDFDLKLIPQRKVFRQGEDVLVDSVVTVRATGCAGWSYGVLHNPQLLEVVSATTVGSDVPSLFSAGFDVTEIVTKDGVEAGWIQAIVLSFTSRRELPISPRFVMAKAAYKVRSGICTQAAQIPTSISYTDTLHVENSPPVDINLTVDGRSVKPAVREPAELTLDCPAPGMLDLRLSARPAEDRKLRADRQDVLSIHVLLGNSTSENPETAEVQGWSYGLKLDPAVLEVTDVTTGAHAAALNGGAGPDFRAYNFQPLEQNSSGSVRGITVGVVIALDPPNDVLLVPVGETRQLEVVKVRSAIVIPAGQADRTTALEFVNEVLGNPLIENIITVKGISIAPKSDSPSLVLTLGPSAPPAARFKRGDSNNDGRFDIADAVKTIRVLFYQDGRFVCRKAADSNDDGRVDLADAIYIIDWQFRGSLKPPAAPWPLCGTDPTDDGPNGLTCEEATRGCA
jgi:hypothetical protein